jgi:hypothetical protein
MVLRIAPLLINFRQHGAVSDYEYTPLPMTDLSHQNLVGHIHLASEIQNLAYNIIDNASYSFDITNEFCRETGGTETARCT